MNYQDKWTERYEEYDFTDYSRDAHRQRKGKKANERGNGRGGPALAEMSDFADDPNLWVPSYCAALDPLHYERQWVIDSLKPFYQQDLITDVARRVKGGKEANVYCCEANPAAGVEWLAAKLYRPRMLRTLKNDAIYKEGRIARDETGKEISGSRARREKTAVAKKTHFGQQLEALWWIGTEFMSQQTLYEAGADVPRPVAHVGNTVVMAFIGDEEGFPAPVLSDVSLERHEARPLLERTLHNVRLMLAHDLIHGDLSPYNILYWEGQITIIDFPQMVSPRSNHHAYDLLARDIRRVCDYFGRFGATAEPETLAQELWEEYQSGRLTA